MGFGVGDVGRGSGRGHSACVWLSTAICHVLQGTESIAVRAGWLCDG